MSSMWVELNDLKETLSPKDLRGEKLKRTITFFLGPAMFILLLLFSPPEGLSIEAWRFLALISWGVVWWVGEPFAVPTTSLLLIFMLPVLNILPPEKVYPNLGNTAIFMLIGAFILVSALTASGLGKRVALWAASRPWVNTPWRLVIVFSLITMILSAVMPNIPTTVLMLGLVVALLDNLKAPFRGNLTSVLLLSTCIPSIIGGMITPIGATAPNFLLIGVMQSTLDTVVPFGLWFVICLPVALLLYVTMLLIWKTLFKLDESSTGLDKARSSMLDAFKQLGKMQKRESYALVALLLAMFFWILPGVVTMILGGDNPTAALLNKYLSMEKVALFIAMLLLVVPLDWKNRQFTLSWREAGSAVDPGLLIFVAVAFTLPAAFTETGLLQYIIGILQGLVGGLPTIVVLLILVTVVSIIVQFNLIMPAIAIAIPISVALIGALGGHPLAAGLSVGMAAAVNTFVLPITTPVVLIPYSTGRISINHFSKGGIVLTIATIIIFTFVLYPLASLVLG